jgi:hypothetical protein
MEYTMMASTLLANGLMGIKTFQDVRRLHRRLPLPTPGSALYYASDDEEGDVEADNDAAAPSIPRFTGKTCESIPQEVQCRYIVVMTGPPIGSKSQRN